MSALVKLLGSYAPGHVLSHGGRDFTFSRIDQATKAALTVAYFRRARETVYLIKGEVEADEYDRQLSHVLDAYRRGRFAFPDGESYAYYFSGEGLPELVRALTGCGPEEAVTLIDERTVEVLHVCLCVAYESMGGESKKKLLTLDDGRTRALADLLSTPTPATPTSNGSPSGKPTSAPGSAARASDPTSSPG